jgi:hypothetical protein
MASASRKLIQEEAEKIEMAENDARSLPIRRVFWMSNHDAAQPRIRFSDERVCRFVHFSEVWFPFIALWPIAFCA